MCKYCKPNGQVNRITYLLTHIHIVIYENTIFILINILLTNKVFGNVDPFVLSFLNTEVVQLEIGMKD